MMTAYRKRFTHARNRRPRRVPYLGKDIIWLRAGGAILLTGWILTWLLVAPIAHPAYHFESERGAITALSAVFLAMASGFAVGYYVLMRTSKDGLRRFWPITACGFLFLPFLDARLNPLLDLADSSLRVE